MGRLIAVLGIAGIASTASADPVFTWSKIVAGGYDVYTMSVQGDQGAAGWNIDVTFTGSFHQNLAYGTTDVNTGTDANTYDAIPEANYAKQTDCWYYDHFWAEVAPDNTDIAGTGTILLSSLGSKPGLTFESADVIQFVVTRGSTITWSGILSYKGEDFNVSGTMPGAPTAVLTLTEKNPDYGDVDFDPEPNDPNVLAFPLGTPLTLTAVPVEGKMLKHWEIFDPNFPNDANYAIIDANASTTTIMNDDMHVHVAWKCGNQLDLMLPMAMGVLGLYALARRRSGGRSRR